MIPSGHLSLRIRADAHLHQLLRSFRLPDVFVGAAPLHAHGLADRARQQHRIFSCVIRRQATVTTGALDPVDADVALREAEHVRDAIARGEWSLRAGPDGRPYRPARPRPRMTGSIIAWFWNGQ